MKGTLVYLHGTGEQKHEKNQRDVEMMLARRPELRDFSVLNIRWAELCPPPAELRPLLPPGQREGDENDARHPVEAFADDLASHFAASGPELDPMRLFTKALIRRRLGLSRVVTDFLQYVVYYFRVSDGLSLMTGIRSHVAERIAQAKQSDPVVVLGHSLGGIIAVDVASDPTRDARIDLTVTVGSQTSLLFALGATPEFEGPERRQPVSPWVNFYNPHDPLAFLAAEVFSWAERPPIDVEVMNPDKLIGSHTDYPLNPQIYQEIADRLAAHGSRDRPNGPPESGG